MSVQPATLPVAGVLADVRKLCATNSLTRSGRHQANAAEQATRVFNGIIWVSRSGVPRHDLPDTFGRYTICCNRFVRSRRAGVSYE
ncbi:MULTISPECIES: transposase [Bradyrhizobium]|uniref:transposase n=1 Tax=Bradyrhizobium pachyrhizi TaxID=280333 RepID=UPI0009E892B1